MLTRPTKVGVALVDILTGLNSVIGIQAALMARDTAGSATAGRGQHVKVTLLGSLLSALANQSSSTLETGVSPGRMGNAHPSISPYETLQTADQAVALAVGTDGAFVRCARCLAPPEVAADPASPTTRAASRTARAARGARGAPAHEARRRVDRGVHRPSIPAGRVNTIAQAIELAESLELAPVATTPAIGPDENSTIRFDRSRCLSPSRRPRPAIRPRRPVSASTRRDAGWR